MTSPAALARAQLGRELGDILRWRDPEAAVAVYDVALARLGRDSQQRESPPGPRAHPGALVLRASSSRAGREAKRRVDEALTILTETKDYPSDRIGLDSELYSVLQALADHHADEGRLREAIQHYDQLLERVMAATPDVENDLRDANNLSLLYRGLCPPAPVDRRD